MSNTTANNVHSLKHTQRSVSCCLLTQSVDREHKEKKSKMSAEEQRTQSGGSHSTTQGKAATAQAEPSSVLHQPSLSVL